MQRAFSFAKSAGAEKKCMQPRWPFFDTEPCPPAHAKHVAPGNEAARPLAAARDARKLALRAARDEHDDARQGAPR